MAGTISGGPLSGPAIAGPADVRPACRLAGSVVPAMAGTVYGAAYGQHGTVPGQDPTLSYFAARSRALGSLRSVSWRQMSCFRGQMQGLSRGTSRFLAETCSAYRRLSGQPIGWPGGIAAGPVGSADVMRAGQSPGTASGGGERSKAPTGALRGRWGSLACRPANAGRRWQGESALPFWGARSAAAVAAGLVGGEPDGRPPVFIWLNGAPRMGESNPRGR